MKVTATIRSAMLILAASVTAISPALGGSIYLKLPNVTGPVTKNGFAGDIELTAYSQGFTNSATIGSGGGASGKVSCGAITLSKSVDLTSQDFLEYVTRGTVIHTATIYFTGNNPNASAATARYRVVLTNVRVTSVMQGDTAGNSAGLGITENISLIAEKFQVTYLTQSADGGTNNGETYGWDCATNTAT